jgi:murein DD-endopeptidase
LITATTPSRGWAGGARVTGARRTVAGRARSVERVAPLRLALVITNGRVRIPQRFAVDWALLGADGRLFRDQPTVPANWYGYGVPVHATASGIVAMVRDGAPDHTAFGPPPPPVMEATDATCNVVVVDIGYGPFATYAHLQQGSLLVSEGDRVVAGQPLARIGNSGNTLGPHLHFQISDAPEPLGGEGVPFSLRSFELIGRVASVPTLLGGTTWRPDARQPARAVTAEMPPENMVMRFSDAGRVGNVR